MGFFNFGKKKTTTQPEPTPEPVKELTPAPQKKPARVDVSTERTTNEEKSAQKKRATTWESPWITVSGVDGWKINIRRDSGEPDIYMKNGKEWFDADKAWFSPSGAYVLHTGMDANGNEGIALASKSAGLRIRKTEGNTA